MDCQNEHRDQVFAEGEWIAPGWITFTAGSSLVHGTLVRGYEGAGPQKADAPDPCTDLMSTIVRMNTALVRQARGHEMDRAISALHGQHTRDGRPSRLIQETE